LTFREEEEGGRERVTTAEDECYDGAEQRSDYIDMKVEWL